MSLDILDTATVDELDVIISEVDEILALTTGASPYELLTAYREATAIDKAEGDEKTPRFPLEPSMVRKLLTTWAAQIKKVQENLREILEQGFSPKISSDQVKRIFGMLEVELSTEFGAIVTEDISRFLDTSYRLGKLSILSDKNIPLTMQSIDASIQAWLRQHHLYWIRTYYDRFLSSRIAETVRQGIEEGLGRAAIGDTLEDFLTKYPGVQVQPRQYYRGLAANAMNRSRNFGQISGWVDAKVTKVQVVNPLDERTSDVCREMVAKTRSGIPIVRVVRQRDLIMAGTHPNDIRTASPWLRYNDIKDLTLEETLSRNFVSPPYHFHCRSELIEVTT